MPFPLPVFKLLLLSLPVLFIRTLAVFIQLLIKLLRGVRATECTAVSVKLSTKRGFKMREKIEGLCRVGCTPGKQHHAE